MNSMEKNTPTEPGVYWARSDEDFKWNNLIVEVYGEAPYLMWKAWDRLHDRLLMAGEPPFFFGPRIWEVPNDPRGQETFDRIKASLRVLVMEVNQLSAGNERSRLRAQTALDNIAKLLNDHKETS